MRKADKAHRFFLGSAFALIALGLVMLTSISIPLSQQNFGESYYYFRHQLLYGFGFGLLLFLIFRKIPQSFLKKIALPLFLSAVALLTLVQVPSLGLEIGGAKRWLLIGGLSFQPSELAKLAIIIYLAAWLDKRKQKIKKLSSVPSFLVILGIITSLVAIQPDLGTTGLIIAVSMIMYLVSGAKWRAILIVLLVGIIIGSTFFFTQPYVRDRIIGFTDTEENAQGKGYQLTQALITIGSGGLWGKGIGHSVQKYQYLPEAIGDSIFAIIAEETGFLGSTIVILLFLTFILSGIKIAKTSKTKFGSYVVIGIVSWIGIQTFMNIGGITKTIPFTGIPLPFLSYGGTALALELAAVGIVSSVARK